jgi:hypothetical protein
MDFSRLDPRGRKRTRPRIEELTPINVHSVLTNKGGIHTVRDGHNELQFIDQMVEGQWRLVVYQNGKPTSISYPIVEKEIGGRIKGDTIWRSHAQYYIVAGGKRCSYLYVDKKNKRVGTRHCFNAVFTIDSISPRQKKDWRALREIQKKAKRLAR